MDSFPRVDVAVYVQNLLGIGHLVRVSALAEAAADLGLRVGIISGGVRPQGYAPRGAIYAQLPACRAADASCKTLLIAATGQEIDAAFLDRRNAQLQRILQDMQPKVIVTEMFPFGRWRLRHELLPMLDAWQGRARLAVSVRDIIDQGSVTGERAEKVAALIESRYDHVLVHGDPLFLPLDKTYPLAARLQQKIIYTGYVQPAATPLNTVVPELPCRNGYVLVSAGGGLFGATLYHLALAAKPLSQRYSRNPWLVVLGPYCPPDVAAAVRTAADADTVVLDHHPALGTLFSGAAVSLSQAGCNTILELLTARTRAVVLPFAEGKETEQSERATLLADMGLLTCLDAASATPASVAAALDNAQKPSLPDEEIHCHGAEVTAMHWQRWVHG